MLTCFFARQRRAGLCASGGTLGEKRLRKLIRGAMGGTGAAGPAPSGSLQGVRPPQPTPAPHPGQRLELGGLGRGGGLEAQVGPDPTSRAAGAV